MAYFREYTSSIIISLTLMSGGTHLGWPSPSLPKLFSADTPIVITRDDSSWIASLSFLGGLVGPFLSIFLLNRIGRRYTLLLTIIPYMTAWILILVAETPLMLFIARFIAGMGFAVSSIGVPMYIGEISSDKIRGRMGVLLITMTKIGVLFVYCVGPYVDFRTLPYIMMIPSILMLLTFFWIPETPIYYLTKNNEADALKSLKFLRTNKTEKDLKLEMETMHNVVKRSQENKVSFKEIFRTRGNLKALLIMIGCQTGMHFSGNAAYLSYAQQIFAAAEGVLGDSESAIISGAVQLVGTLISTAVVDKLGRRPLLLSSIGGVLICNLIMGTYFFYKDYLQSDISSFTWVPLTVFIIFMSVYNIGLSTVSFALLGEFFAINIKAVAATITIVYSNVLAFAIIKLFQVVSDAFGDFVTFWGLSILSSTVYVFIFLLLPETKGVSLEEIQQRLTKISSKPKSQTANIIESS